MFFWEKDSVAAVKIETSCLGDDGELDASVCEDAFEADSLSGPGEGGGVGYASWPEWDLDCQVERKLSSPLTFGRSHWYMIGRGEVGGRERTCSSISAELAIWLCGQQSLSNCQDASLSPAAPILVQRKSRLRWLSSRSLLASLPSLSLWPAAPSASHSVIHRVAQLLQCERGRRG